MAGCLLAVRLTKFSSAQKRIGGGAQHRDQLCCRRRSPFSSPRSFTAACAQDFFPADAQPALFAAPPGPDAGPAPIDPGFYDALRSEFFDNQTPGMFVNDANANRWVQDNEAVPMGNGFGAGVPEDRSGDVYVAPQLEAPRPEMLPQVFPPPGAVQAPEARAADVPVDDARNDVVPVQPAQPIENEDIQPRGGDLDSAAQPAPVTPAPSTSAPTLAPTPPPATPSPTTSAPKSEVKTTEFSASTTSSEASSSGSSAAHVATFFAAGAGCVVAVAGVMYLRRRKRTKQAKTPGTPKNELTFFHVQAHLTPPMV
ncbi:hypothetical protein PINS_up002249 [Pythium insidiosum]|nr:hypothetical protein PINS_up002249 [Pythium insidiosum]